MMKKNKRLFTPDAPGGPPRKKEGIRSWLKIQVESEGYQPPRGGAVLLQVLVGLLFFVFVVRFWYLQVHRGEEFARQAQENRLRQERIFAPRGRILDDGDKLLADNRRKLDEIAQYLYEKETISGEEFMRILNAQPQLPAGPSADSTNQAQ